MDLCYNGDIVVPEYIIHIGPPKVGSKYLQTSLAARSVGLKEAGIYYPVNEFSPTREVWHKALCDRLKSGNDDGLKGIFDALNRANYSYIVFSFEGFFGLSDAVLNYLKALIGDNAVRIVYYCRHLSERIPSLWVQNVKEGYSEVFPFMYARSLNDLLIAPDFNNRLVWERFARIFDRKSLNLVSFSNLRDQNIDLIEHFSRTFLNLETLPPADRPSSIDKNVSPDVYHTEVLRAMNAIYRNENGTNSNLVRRKFLSRDDDDLFEKVKFAMNDSLQSIMIDERRGIFELVYNEVSRFKDRLINPTPSGEFFTRAATSFHFVNQDYLLNRSTTQAIFELYTRTMES